MTSTTLTDFAVACVYFAWAACHMIRTAYTDATTQLQESL